MDLLLIVAVLLAPPPLPAAPKSAGELAEHLRAVVKDSRPAAAQAPATFEELVTDENFRSLGFESKEEAKAAELGVPFPVVAVRLDELKRFKTGDDPLALLHPLRRAIYPITVKGQVRSGLTVHAKDGEWGRARSVWPTRSGGTPRSARPTRGATRRPPTSC